MRIDWFLVVVSQDNYEGSMWRFFLRVLGWGGIGSRLARLMARISTARAADGWPRNGRARVLVEPLALARSLGLSVCPAKHAASSMDRPNTDIEARAPYFCRVYPLRGALSSTFSRGIGLDQIIINRMALQWNVLGDHFTGEFVLILF